MKRTATIALSIVALGLATGLLLFADFMSRGVSTRRQPAALEVFIARRLRRLAIPRKARDLKNPEPMGPNVLTEAKSHFADHCASCHGNDGSGKTPIGESLYPKAPDMRLADTQTLSDGELFYIIENGVRFTGMPAWGTGNPEDERQSWNLVHFIRHLPEQTAEEVEEMKQMNPKSPEDLREEEAIRKFLEGGDSAPPQPHAKH